MTPALQSRMTPKGHQDDHEKGGQGPGLTTQVFKKWSFLWKDPQCQKLLLAWSEGLSGKECRWLKTASEDMELPSWPNSTQLHPDSAC